MTAAPDGVRQVKASTANLSTPAQLGSNAVSAGMTGKFAGRAEGDAMALSPLLDQYRDLVLQTRDAVDTAMAAYQATEVGTAGDLSGR